MNERSRFWDGTSVGHATEAPYDAPTEFAQVLSSVAGADFLSNRGGVFEGALNDLEVTGTATPVSVNTGRAIVYGNWYENDAAVTVAIPTPAASTRIDRIVLRKSWADKTVAITRIAGVEGGAAPALVQVAGTTWDIPLANVSITTGGVITVTDTREYVGSGSGATAVQIELQAGIWSFPSSNFPEPKNYQGLANWGSWAVLAFDQTTEEACFSSFVVPHGIDFTTCTAYVHSTQPAATSGTVGWKITTIAVGDGESLQTAGNTDTVTAETVPGTAESLQVISKVLTSTGWVGGDEVQIKIARDVANDTVAEDVYFRKLLLVFEL